MGAVAGIELPEGSPGAARDAAAGLRRAAGGFERTGGVAQRAIATVGSWQGLASFNFRDRCGDYSSAADAAAQACDRAEGVLNKYAHRLEEGREYVKRLQVRAQDCLDRIHAANQRADEAAERARFASHMAYQASMGSGADGGASAAAFRQQADDARSDQQAALDAAARAQDELDRLRDLAHDERVRVKEAGRVAAGLVAGAVSELPTVSVPGPPPAPAKHEEEDKPWYEDAADAFADGAKWTGGQLVGAGKGVGEGVVGIGKGGYYLYRLSAFNQTFNPGDYDEAQQQLSDTASFAWHHPGDFGKAVINWDDLSHGRYGEWAGNLAPDVALAFFTAGSGTAATRGLRGAEAAEDVGDAARTVDRVGEAARGAEGAGAAGTAGAAGRIPADAMTDAGRAAAARGDHVVRHWTPLDTDRPLPEQQLGDTFRSSTYDEVKLGHSRVFERVYSDPNRKLSAFWTRQPSHGPLQSILDNAILPEFGNSATHTVRIEVPAGTTVFEGPAALQHGTRYGAELVGGGDQVVIQHVEPSWVIHP